MQAEVDRLRDTGSFEVATAAELKKVGYKDVLPMKMVCDVKRDGTAQTEKKKARAVICGNFQEKSAHEELYTASADITSVRAVLAASVPRKFDAKVIDIKTAFLNAKLPDQMETVFARPPQGLVEFGLVQPGEIWRVQNSSLWTACEPECLGRRARCSPAPSDGANCIGDASPATVPHRSIGMGDPSLSGQRGTRNET